MDALQTFYKPVQDCNGCEIQFVAMWLPVAWTLSRIWFFGRSSISIKNADVDVVAFVGVCFGC